MSNARDDSTDDQTTQLVPGGYPATVTGPASPADPPPRPSADTATPRADTEVMPPHPPTEVAHPPTEVAHPPTEVAAPHAVTRTASPHPAAHAAPTNAAPPSTAPPGRPTEIVRYGPGVPAPATAAAPAAPTAEEVWRTGRLPGPSHRRARLRRLAGPALTVILLAASGIIFYLRFHHAPFQVTGVAITAQARSGCGTEVTGRFSTDGSAGTVSYQWLFGPGQPAAQPLRQSVAAGQHAVDVQVALDGQGHGSAWQPVTLRVLGPHPRTAGTSVLVSC